MKIPLLHPVLLLAVLPVLGACGEGATAPASADAATPVAAAGPGSKAGGGPEYRSHVNGDHAYASSYDPATGTWAYVSVSRDRRGGRDVAELYYSADRCYDPGDGWWTCEWLAAGWGQIPASDLHGTGRNRLELRTDTRDNPDFQVWVGERGPVEIVWEGSAHHGSRRSGSQEDRYFTTLIRSSGVSTYSSAHAEGRIVGIPLTTAGDGWPNGSMGTANNTTLIFQRAAPN